MSTHDHHDMARLAELAVSDPEGTEVRAMVKECPECAEEFQLQLEAIAHLGELQPVRLTETELNRVRQGVWESLHEGVESPSPVPEPTPSPVPRRPWYAGLVGAAAALVVVAGLGYFLVDNPFIGGDDGAVPEAAEDTITAEEEAPADMTAAAAETTESRDEAGATEFADGDGSATTAAADTTAAEGTVAASEETVLEPDAAAVSEVLDPASADAVVEVVEDLRVTAAARAARNPGSLNLSQREERCLETRHLDRVLAVDSITVAQRRFMVVSHQVGDATEVDVFDLAGCTEVSLP